MSYVSKKEYQLLPLDAIIKKGDIRIDHITWQYYGEAALSIGKTTRTAISDGDRFVRKNFNRNFLEEE